MRRIAFILVWAGLASSILLGCGPAIADSWDPLNQDGVIFPQKDRYFPEAMVQYRKPLFIWDDFVTYRQDLWGDNQNGKMTIRTEERLRPNHSEKEPLINGKLILKDSQMVWLLKRLTYGQVECRWCSIGNAVKGNDKFIGFGDPAEGYAAGFRLFDQGQGAGLFAFVINQGNMKVVPIPWQKDYASSTRFIISREPGKIEFMTITATKFSKVAVVTNKDLPTVGLPKIPMEISLQSILGPEEVMIDLIKYDAY